jgi:AcrR family transcriptional regulator
MPDTATLDPNGATRRRADADEIRSRIIDVAEEHFRRIGYAKTTVADIAQTLGMSPANVYRFFPSKNAINNAICERMMDTCHAAIAEIVARPLPAGERIRDIIVVVHNRNRCLLTHERRLHDMVEVAMAQNWQAIDRHLQVMRAFFVQLVVDGQSTGEFDATLDAETAGTTILDCCCAVFHPTVIAQIYFSDDDESADRIAQFILRSLRWGPRS